MVNDVEGDARRNCSKTELWAEPDLFNCTNKDFVSLESTVCNVVADSQEIGRDGIYDKYCGTLEMIPFCMNLLDISGLNYEIRNEI